MRTRNVALSAIALGMVIVLGLGLTFAQEGSRRSRWTPEQIHQRSMERIKEAVTTSEDEWKALEPKLDEIVKLSREAGVYTSFRRRRSSSTTDAQTPLTGVAKATQDLETTLGDEKAKPEEITAKLTALRDARKKAKEELATARKSASDLVNLRQEAQLVLLGILD